MVWYLQCFHIHMSHFWFFFSQYSMTQWHVTGIRWTACESRSVAVSWLSGWAGYSFGWGLMVFVKPLQNSSKWEVNLAMGYKEWQQKQTQGSTVYHSLAPSMDRIFTPSRVSLCRGSREALESPCRALAEPRRSIWENIRQLTPEGDGLNLNFYCHFTPVVVVIFGWPRKLLRIKVMKGT